MYTIDNNGVRPPVNTTRFFCVYDGKIGNTRYQQQTLPSFGKWWSKNVKITRQDGLDVIFMPIK